MLFYLLAGTLAVMWMLDAFFTVQVLGKKGNRKEANDLMRSLYRRSVLLFLASKTGIMAFVLAALFMLSKDYPVTAESIIFIFIYVYAKVDWHNYKIWKNRNSGAEGKKTELKKNI